MKNIDKIRQMTADELAELFDIQPRCKLCASKYNILNCDFNCKNNIKQWLEQEVEE